jgi:hypothetical protein
MPALSLESSAVDYLFYLPITSAFGRSAGYLGCVWPVGCCYLFGRSAACYLFG